MVHFNPQIRLTSRKSCASVPYLQPVDVGQVVVDFRKKNGDVHPELEILVSAEHNHDFVAREQAATVTAAFDLAIAKMEMQLRKYKERVQNHKGAVPMSGTEEA